MDRKWVRVIFRSILSTGLVVGLALGFIHSGFDLSYNQDKFL